MSLKIRPEPFVFIGAIRGALLRPRTEMLWFEITHGHPLTSYPLAFFKIKLQMKYKAKAPSPNTPPPMNRPLGSPGDTNQ